MTHDALSQAVLDLPALDDEHNDLKVKQATVALMTALTAAAPASAFEALSMAAQQRLFQFLARHQSPKTSTDDSPTSLLLGKIPSPWTPTEAAPRGWAPDALRCALKYKQWAALATLLEDPQRPAITAQQWQAFPMPHPWMTILVQAAAPTRVLRAALNAGASVNDAQDPALGQADNVSTLRQLFAFGAEPSEAPLLRLAQNMGSTRSTPSPDGSFKSLATLVVEAVRETHPDDWMQRFRKTTQELLPEAVKFRPHVSHAMLRHLDEAFRINGGVLMYPSPYIQKNNGTPTFVDWPIAASVFAHQYLRTGKVPMDARFDFPFDPAAPTPGMPSVPLATWAILAWSRGSWAHVERNTLLPEWATPEAWAGAEALLMQPWDAAAEARDVNARALRYRSLAQVYEAHPTPSLYAHIQHTLHTMLVHMPDIPGLLCG